MTDVGFVGEVGRQPLQEPKGVARVARSVALLLAVLCFLAIAVGGIALGAYATPFDYYDAISVIGIAIGPTLLVLAGAKLLAPGAGGPMKRLDVLCGLVVFFVIIPGNYLLYLNQALDRSPAVEEVVPVEDAWIRTDRHSHRTYMVNVKPIVESPLRRWSFYKAQPISLDAAEWRGLIPGQSMLALRIHRGRLGFAWYEADPPVAGLQSPLPAAI